MSRFRLKYASTISSEKTNFGFNSLAILFAADDLDSVHSSDLSFLDDSSDEETCVVSPCYMSRAPLSIP